MPKTTLEIILNGQDNFTKKTTAALSNLGKIAGGVALAGVAALGAGVIALGRQAIPAASNLNEALNATSVVFGEAAGKVQDFGKQAADSAGLSAAAFNQLAAQSGAMLQNFGLDASTAADETIKLTQRAADMASIFNTDVNDAFVAINAALRGEADPIERFGVSMNALAVDAKALELGFKKVNGQFTNEAKTQARLALLYEQTDKIAGDFVNTSDQLANGSRVLQARWENFMARIGQFALPIIQQFQNLFLEIGERVFPLIIKLLEPIIDRVGVFSERLVNLISTLLDAGPASLEFREALTWLLGEELTEALGGIISGVKDFIDWIKEAVAPIVAWIQNNIELKDVLIALGIAISTIIIPIVAGFISSMLPIIAVFAAVVLAVSLLRRAWEENWFGMRDKLKEIWDVVGPLLESIWKWLQVNVPEALEKLRSFWVDTAWPAIQKALENAWSVISGIFTSIQTFINENIIPAAANLYNQWTTVWWPEIQQRIETVWAIVQPIWDDMRDWLENKLPSAVAFLVVKWVEGFTVIQEAVRISWGIIKPFWAEILTWIYNRFVPGILYLASQWVKGFSVMLEAGQIMWTIIKAVWTEIGRWINDNLVPWILYLRDQWLIGFGIIYTAVELAWGVIKPIWELIISWLSVKLPVAVDGFKANFESGMNGITEALSPVKSLWDSFVSAVQSFWNWIKTHTFEFKIKLPDLPDWALPGSPLPIHTAWKNFARDLQNMSLPIADNIGSIGLRSGLAQASSIQNVTLNINEAGRRGNIIDDYLLVRALAKAA